MIPFQNPSIELFGLRVDEPITLITDLIISWVGFMAYFNTASDNNSPAVKLYRYFFLFTAISTLVAGFIGHGFAYRIGFEYRMIGWMFGVAGVAFAQFAAVYHTRTTIGEKNFNLLKVINGIELAIIVIVLAVYRLFAIVEIQAAIGLVLVVSVLEGVHYARTRSVLSIKMIYGISITILAVIAHVGKLAISNWFNHMDLGHVLMATSLFVMYKGLKAEQKLNLVTT
jgi:hypothetical protein